MSEQARTGMGVADIIGSRREAILRLAARHGASHVRVFGSVARGEAGPDSDLDLLVEWDLVRISAWGGSRLDIELYELLGRKVEVVSLEDLHWSMRPAILAEAVPL